MESLSPPPCPFLPAEDRVYTVDDILGLGRRRDAEFYHTALHYAQTLWRIGFPAKTLLLINRALSCHLPDHSLQTPSQPYHAVAWTLRHRPEGKFIGNPRRHYQHLATRMVPPFLELRTWRAWACWYLAKTLLEETEYPGDAKQIREEGIVEPTRQDIATHLSELSPADDLAAWQAALHWAQAEMGIGETPISTVTLAVADVNGLPMVQDLAHRIWPECYKQLLSAGQIEYMLQEMYGLEKLTAELQRGVRYALIESNGRPVGFMAWEYLSDGGLAFLHKLYVLPSLHGQGIGGQALAWVESLAREQGTQHLQLRVNRKNHKAIRAYLRRGFVFTENLCTDIGQGYVMDDHVMTLDLK
jgi:GNAT superfamily N-acetyltransferase